MHLHTVLQLHVSSLCPLCRDVSPLCDFELRQGNIPNGLDAYRRRWLRFSDGDAFTEILFVDVRRWGYVRFGCIDRGLMSASLAITGFARQNAILSPAGVVFHAW